MKSQYIEDIAYAPQIQQSEYDQADKKKKKGSKLKDIARKMANKMK